MKKAAGILLLLFAVSFLHYYGIEKPLIITSGPEFLSVLGDVKTGTAEFTNFIQLFGNFLFSMSVIFISFGLLWVAIDMLVSKEKSFKIHLTKNPLVLLSSGTGLLFGGMFASAFAALVRFHPYDASIEMLLAIAALEFTITFLRYLNSPTGHYVFEISVGHLR